MALSDHSPQCNALVASLIGRSGSSAYQTIHRCGVYFSRGLALLFGIGIKALDANAMLPTPTAVQRKR